MDDNTVAIATSTITKIVTNNKNRRRKENTVNKKNIRKRRRKDKHNEILSICVCVYAFI